MSKMNGTAHRPDQKKRVTKMTLAVMAAMGDATVEEALTVCVNIAGQLCAQISGGKPSAIQSSANNIAENIKNAAINKILHDDEKRRGDQAEGDAVHEEET